MDAAQIRQLGPKLKRFLKQFDDCFSRKDTREHLPVFIKGQLSDLPEKSVEPIAVEAGVAPRTLQEFLSLLKWDQDQMRDRLQAIVRTEHAGRHAIGMFDETSDPKKGDKTPGVQKQWCGRLGKTENCIVTVHLGYAVEDFHCLLDGELFLPESWAGDRERCREAGIPDTMVYRPKWQIALELYDRAVANGISFAWMTFDEGYGGKPDCLRGLTARGQLYVGEMPRNFTGWLKAPRVVTRTYHAGRRGRGRRVPRLASGSRRAQAVGDLMNASPLRDQPWQRWRVKDSEKGPVVWECKHVLFYPKDENGLPGAAQHLLVARNVLDPSEIKFFISNAPANTSVGTLLKVAFSRWRIERCFEDQKSEIGLDQYEGRRYLGLKRHLILSSVSYLFLARVREEWAGEKSTADGVPTAHGDGGAGALVVAGAAGLGAFAGEDGREDHQETAEQCPRAAKPHKKNTPPLARVRHSTYSVAAEQLELAL
jgi:SRSO17 transposase